MSKYEQQELSPAEELLLAQIMEFDSNVQFNFQSIVVESLNHLKETEDDMDECLIDISFMKFLHWALDGMENRTIFREYKEHIMVFEEIINSNLKNEDIRGLQGIPGLIAQMTGDRSAANDLTTPLSGVELEFEKRLTKLYDTKKNFIEIFKSIPQYKGYSWDDFAELL